MVGKGGEASVYRGDFGGRAVVVREVVMPRTSWCLPAGRKIIKVIATGSAKVISGHIIFPAYTARGNNSRTT